jgi:ketosteroid isomerase-like protein
MDEHEDFVASMKRRHAEAERALLNGEPELYLAMWSTRDPVTAMGAMGREVTTSGLDGVSQALKLVASRNSDCTDYVFDVTAAEVLGDMAYTVGFEHFTSSFRGGPPNPRTFRVTHIYRRENGDWKLAHRHADVVSDADVSQMSQTSESASPANPD